MDSCTTVNCLSGVMYALRPKAHNFKQTSIYVESEGTWSHCCGHQQGLWNSMGPVDKHEHTHTQQEKINDLHHTCFQ